MRIVAAVKQIYAEKPSTGQVFEQKASKLLSFIFENFQYQWQANPEALYQYALILTRFEAYPQIELLKRSSTFNSKGNVNFYFQVKTVAGELITTGIKASQFKFSLLKSGKFLRKSKVSTPKKSSKHPGRWQLRLTRESAPVIGELMIQGQFTDESGSVPVFHEVRSHVFSSLVRGKNLDHDRCRARALPL